MPRKKTDTLDTPSTPRPRTTRSKAAASSNGAATANGAAGASAGVTADRGVTAASYVPSYSEIAEAAYLRFVNRGGVHGADFDDWLEAERELRARS